LDGKSFENHLKGINSYGKSFENYLKGTSSDERSFENYLKASISLDESLTLESLILQLGDEALIKLTMMITYISVSTMTTTKFSIHEDVMHKVREETQKYEWYFLSEYQCHD